MHGIAAAEAIPHIEAVTLTARPGGRVVPLPEGGEYLGFIFARAPDPATAEAALREAHAVLHFELAAEGAEPARDGGDAGSRPERQV